MGPIPFKDGLGREISVRCQTTHDRPAFSAAFSATHVELNTHTCCMEHLNLSLPVEMLSMRPSLAACCTRCCVGGLAYHVLAQVKLKSTSTVSWYLLRAEP